MTGSIRLIESMTMRLKAEIWVKAYVRRCNAAGAFAVVARRGDADAGAIFVRVTRRDGSAELFGPAPAGLDAVAQDRRWVSLMTAAQGEDRIDQRLASEMRIDADVWIIDIEDADGRHFLDDWVVSAT